MNDIIAEIEKYNLSSMPSYVLDEDVCQFLVDRSQEYNAELTLKEAGSWEAATRIVLTD